MEQAADKTDTNVLMLQKLVEAVQRVRARVEGSECVAKLHIPRQCGQHQVSLAMKSPNGLACLVSVTHSIQSQSFISLRHNKLNRSDVQDQRDEGYFPVVFNYVGEIVGDGEGREPQEFI
ncbi:hypothetical protein E2C01_040226 [Portunus trituberculatus]|uniref:Uncharacterized protein n=1 Tax=Portunus trituberculatus TaxID=210409 RepID=A0A5B7FLZ3_PORTR|nr:hypothetical protein [Portunus trituberculatus]